MAAHAADKPFAVWAASHPLAANFGVSATSVAAGVLLTNWVDVIKVRQQLAGAHGANMALTCYRIVRHEGPLALYRGVVPAVVRGVLYGGLRIGLYDPIKAALGADVPDAAGALPRKIAAGMLSGALAAAACNPTDLVKTRMQSAGAARAGPIAVAAAVAREGGLRALWRGTTPSMARAALLTAAQCATYDEVKLLFVRRLGWEDTVGTHFAVSTVAGLVTTTVTSPADMVKTNVFVKAQFASPMQCLAAIYREQGVRGLFRGWGANWARQGPMTTVIFVVMEFLRSSLGLETI